MDITIIGTKFLDAPSVSVLVSSTPCGNVRVTGTTQIVCQLGPGAGSDQYVTVSAQGQVRANACSFVTRTTAALIILVLLC